MTKNFSYRREEQHALDCILKNQNSSPKVTHEPNGVATAPDFLLDFDTYKIDLEVTISGDGFILTDDAPTYPKGREVFERSSDNMLKKLESLIASWIKPGETIIVTFLTHIPVKNRGKLAQEIANKLKQTYLTRIFHRN